MNARGSLACSLWVVSIVHRAVINVSLFPVPRLKDEPQRRNIYDNDDES